MIMISTSFLQTLFLFRALVSSETRKVWERRREIERKAEKMGGRKKMIKKKRVKSSVLAKSGAILNIFTENCQFKRTSAYLPPITARSTLTGSCSLSMPAMSLMQTRTEDLVVSWIGSRSQASHTISHQLNIHEIRPHEERAEATSSSLYL